MTPLLAQRQGRDRAFERLYRRHVADVYRYAFAVMRNQPDAEDITQTTFMNAYRAFQRGERPEKPHNWLIAIAHNVCRQRFRQSARRPVEVAFDEDVAASLVESEEAPTGDDIRRALGHLAFTQRAALVMRELEGRSYAEIADILELTSSAVETLIFRARRALREQLESSLTCAEAERAISKQLDGRLPRAGKGALRAHLRGCPDCATLARRQRAQRTAFKSLAVVPLPPWLGSFFGGGGASVGSGLAVKAAVAVTAGVAIGGAGYAGVHEAVTHHHRSSVHVAAPPPQAVKATPIRQAPDLRRAAFAGSPRVTRSRHATKTRQTSRTAARKQQSQHARRARGQLAAGSARGHRKPVPAARAQRPLAHVTHVTHSNRPVAPPGQTKPHHVAQPKPKPASHGKPPAQGGAGNGKGNANGHGK